MNMGYVDSNLMSGETVVYRTKLHWIILAPAGLLAALLLAGGAVFLLYPQARLGGPVCLLAAALVIVGPAVRYGSSEFAVTNKRVAIKVGWLHRRTLEMVLQKVESIAVDQGVMGRLLGYGTLTVHGTGGTPETFDKIRAPLEFRRYVNEQLSAIH
jgi:membrane protein YdbS with pleckstrin-like domain